MTNARNPKADSVNRTDLAPSHRSVRRVLKAVRRVWEDTNYVQERLLDPRPW